METQIRDTRIVLSPIEQNDTTRRRITVSAVDVDPDSAENGKEKNKDDKKERRRSFNLVKHSISIILVILDIIFDWYQYGEMSATGNYTIEAERRINNVKFTHKCEGSGKDVQFIFLIFTIVGTCLAILQITNIGYQIKYEKNFKSGKINEKKKKKLLPEVVEVFVFLLFIEISQMLLVLGFYDVCTLDCVIGAKQVIVILSGLFSFAKLFWRFSSGFKCCTYKRTTPKPKHPPQMQRQHPNIERKESWTTCCSTLPFSSSTKESNLHESSCNCRKNIACEQNFRCCLWRLCPSYLDQPKTDWFECLCGQCMSCEQMCSCCIIRCFPSKLDEPHSDIWTCRCADCLACVLPCKCFTFRCFPEHLNPPHSDICTCRCGDCMAFKLPCKCFTFRCFPKYLNPPNLDICKCRCADCLACALPCKCFTFRCFPEYLNPPHSDMCTCKCGDCMAFELPCKCFTFRCFPSHLNPPKPDVCTCLCAEVLSCEFPCKCFTARCFPKYLKPPMSDWYECTCGDCMKCEKSCCCCILRCFPSLIDKEDICTCIFKECVACEKNLKCFICRCFPTTLDPSKPEVCLCTCGICLACKTNCACCLVKICPSHLDPPEETCFECLCCKNEIAPAYPSHFSQSSPLPVHQPSFHSVVVQTEQPRPFCPLSCCSCCSIDNTPTTPFQPSPTPPPPSPSPPPPPSPPRIVQVVTHQPRPYIFVIPDPPRRTPDRVPDRVNTPRPQNRKSLSKDLKSCSLGITAIVVTVLLVIYCYVKVVHVIYLLSCITSGSFSFIQDWFVSPFLTLFNL